MAQPDFEALFQAAPSRIWCWIPSVRFIIHRVEGVTDFVRLQAEGDLMEMELGAADLVLSADATGRQREPLLAAGALDYLTKPIGVRALLEVIDRVLAPAPMAARSD